MLGVTREGSFPLGFLGRVLDPNVPVQKELPPPRPKCFLITGSHESILVQLSRGQSLLCYLDAEVISP